MSIKQKGPTGELVTVAVGYEELDEAVSMAVSSLYGSKADRPAESTAGNLAGLNGSGNLTDSGVVATEVATKAFVNSSVQSQSANYVTGNTSGAPFATKQALSSASVYYFNGAAYTPTKNDYALVLSDSTAPTPFTGGQVRYVNTSSTATPNWVYQYGINETPYTAAQNNAINSGITAAKVSTYDGYADAFAKTGAANTFSAAQTINAALTVTGGVTSPSLQKSAGGGYIVLPTIPAGPDKTLATLDAVYPVGAIYSSTSSVSPASLFGGTWEAYMTGRVLIGAGTLSGTTYSAGSTGGASTVTLTTDQIPSHSHTLGTCSAGNFGTNRLDGSDGAGANFFPSTASTGGGEAHENMPPYAAIYRFRRTA